MANGQLAQSPQERYTAVPPIDTGNRLRSRHLTFPVKAMQVHVKTSNILAIVLCREQASTQSILASQRCIRSIKSKPSAPDVFDMSCFCSVSIDLRLDFLFRARRCAVLTSVCFGCNVAGGPSFSIAFGKVFSCVAEYLSVLLDGLSARVTVTAPHVEQDSFLVCSWLLRCLLGETAAMYLVKVFTLLQDHPSINIAPQALQLCSEFREIELSTSPL